MQRSPTVSTVLHRTARHPPLAHEPSGPRNCLVVVSQRHPVRHDCTTRRTPRGDDDHDTSGPSHAGPPRPALRHAMPATMSPRGHPALRHAYRRREPFRAGETRCAPSVIALHLWPTAPAPRSAGGPRLAGWPPSCHRRPGPASPPPYPGYGPDRVPRWRCPASSPRGPARAAARPHRARLGGHPCCARRRHWSWLEPGRGTAVLRLGGAGLDVDGRPGWARSPAWRCGGGAGVLRDRLGRWPRSCRRQRAGASL